MTEPRIFKPGDKVKIRNRTDSPIMKVIKYKEKRDALSGSQQSTDTVIVEWFDKEKGEAHKDEIHQMALLKAE